MDIIYGFIFGFAFCWYARKDIEQIVHNFRTPPAQLAAERKIKELEDKLKEVEKK